MEAYLGEVLGTFLLIILGLGVSANVSLKKTYGSGGGWLLINWGWAIAVFVGVFVSAGISGAHINPAVTIALAIAGKFSWALVPGYIIAQFVGAIIAAVLIWIHFKNHFEATEDQGTKLGVFSTAPAIKDTWNNFYSEMLGTFVLVLAVLYLAAPDVGLGSIEALPVGLLVLGIGISLGGTTGYAINPARDLGPRIAHALLPIKGKGGSNWEYSWIPVFGPLAGGVLAAIVYGLLPF
ncbi:MAG: aquaporin family protein [Balneolaceae bacterium]|nr:aquaporin family protein [Balneolaceae bacterium]MBO6545567.1 aquaporin family protein [Balneolaceae bacterium]MBO6646963.1 aquaporin family protein [Balneolaceae bacterium]